MVQELISHLQQRQNYLLKLVHDLTGTSTGKPRIVTNLDDLDLLERQKITGASPLFEGVYIHSSGTIVVNPERIIQTSRDRKRLGVSVHPRYFAERVLAKEYGQHVRHSLLDNATIPVSDTLSAMFVNSYTEACGLATMQRIAGQIPHRDDYYRQFYADRDMLSLYLAQNIRRGTPDRGVRLKLALAYEIAEKAVKLDLEGFRAWFRANPLDVRDEMGEMHQQLTSRVSSFI